MLGVEVEDKGGAGAAQWLDHPAGSPPGMRTPVIYCSINTSTDFPKKKKEVEDKVALGASHIRLVLSGDSPCETAARLSPQC